MNNNSSTPFLPQDAEFVFYIVYGHFRGKSWNEIQSIKLKDLDLCGCTTFGFNLKSSSDNESDKLNHNLFCEIKHRCNQSCNPYLFIKPHKKNLISDFPFAPSYALPLIAPFLIDIKTWRNTPNLHFTFGTKASKWIIDPSTAKSPRITIRRQDYHNKYYFSEGQDYAFVFSSFVQLPSNSEGNSIKPQDFGWTRDDSFRYSDERHKTDKYLLRRI